VRRRQAKLATRTFLSLYALRRVDLRCVALFSFALASHSVASSHALRRTAAVVHSTEVLLTAVTLRFELVVLSSGTRVPHEYPVSTPRVPVTLRFEVIVLSSTLCHPL
jgi:hypothetical protein